MNQDDSIRYREVLESYNDAEYLYYTIAYHGAPTLANEKPSSLLIEFTKDLAVLDSYLYL